MFYKTKIYLALFGLFIFFLQNSDSFAQVIDGSIINKPKNLIITIITKEGSNDDVKEFKIVKENRFLFNLKKNYDTLMVSCKINGYETKTFSFLRPTKNDKLNVEFILIKDTIQTLEEVIIKSKKRFYEKKDTIGYIVSEYTDGTERKVKDILKKLPQIEVIDKTGVVKYKGKEIETITLDGDNLFDKNYIIATKNINANIIKAVEAIENYEENPLLKGINDSGKVSLNLILKERKTDFSGDIEFGLGTLNENELALGIQGSVLGINKKYKNFISINHNNIGINSSSIDYENDFKSNTSNSDDFYQAAAILKPSTIFTQFGTERGNINDYYFGSVNTLIPVNKKIKIRLDGHYLKDELEGSNLSEQTLLNPLTNSTTQIFDQTSYSNKPRVYSGIIDFTYFIDKKSLFSFKTKNQSSSFDEIRKIISNTDQFDLDLKSKNSFYNNILEYTRKLNDSLIFQSQINFSKNNIPQELILQPNQIFDDKIQFSNFNKRYFSFSNQLIAKYKNVKYGTQIKFYNSILNFKSYLNENNTISNENNIIRNNTSFSNLSYISYRYNLWRFSLKNRLEFLNQKSTELESKFNFIVNPSLAVAYAIGENHSISFSTEYNEQMLNLENIFINPVLTNNRTILLNNPSLELQRKFNLGLNYNYNNLYNQFAVSSNIQYSLIQGDYFEDITFDDENIIIKNFFLAEQSRNFSFNFSIKKYIEAISSNVKITNNFNYNQYFNLINNSQLRNNKLFGFNTSIEFNTAFDFPINFGNEVSFNYNENRFDIGKNVFKSISNNMKIIFKPNNEILSSLSSSYFKPNLQNKGNVVNFLDFLIEYKPKQKNLSLGFHANNLLGNNLYKSLNISDFSTSKFQNQLLGRLFMLSVEFSL